MEAWNPRGVHAQGQKNGEKGDHEGTHLGEKRKHIMSNTHSSPHPLALFILGFESLSRGPSLEPSLGPRCSCTPSAPTR